MMRQMISRLLVVLIGLAGAAITCATLVIAAPGWAEPSGSASPSPPAPVRSVQITGDTLPQTIAISGAIQPGRLKLVLSEVDWLVDRTGAAPSPAADTLGPKLVVLLLRDDVAEAELHLYPLASGGPRAYRPAEQPGDRKVAESWYYGRLSMPTSLTQAGVPLNGPGPGGAGGGGEPPLDPDYGGMFSELRRGVGLSVLVVLVIAAGVFAIAYLARRQG